MLDTISAEEITSSSPQSVSSNPTRTYAEVLGGERRNSSLSSLHSPAVIAVAEPAAEPVVPVAAVPVLAAVPAEAAEAASPNPTRTYAEVLGGGRGNSSLSSLHSPAVIAVAEPAAEPPVVPVAAVPVLAAVPAEAAEAPVPGAADAVMSDGQKLRYHRLRDESLRGPDAYLESIGQQRARHEPYGNLSKASQREYMAALQEDEDNEAAARAHIYSPGERPFVDTPIIHQLSHSRRNAIAAYKLIHSDTIAVWNDIHNGSDEVEEPHCRWMTSCNF